jgi:hypothetical protein
MCHLPHCYGIHDCHAANMPAMLLDDGFFSKKHEDHLLPKMVFHVRSATKSRIINWAMTPASVALIKLIHKLHTATASVLDRLGRPMLWQRLCKMYQDISPKELLI